MFLSADFRKQTLKGKIGVVGKKRQTKVWTVTDAV